MADAAAAADSGTLTAPVVLVVVAPAVAPEEFDMPRPRCRRHIGFSPEVTYFKPRGVPMAELGELALSAEELEALRLADVEDLSQVEAAERMGVSQPTFARELGDARRKVARALVEGLAIRLEPPSAVESRK